VSALQGQLREKRRREQAALYEGTADKEMEALEAQEAQLRAELEGDSFADAAPAPVPVPTPATAPAQPRRAPSPSAPEPAPAPVNEQ
jgi:hypothetical protein